MSLTRFELARILGARSLQIAQGAPILIKATAEMRNPSDIAMCEFEEGLLPLTVIRQLPNGDRALLDLSEAYGKTKKQRAS